MTTSTFKYLAPNSYDPLATLPFQKPWSKVDGPGTSFHLTSTTRPVLSLRHQLTQSKPSSPFTTDTCGFSLHTSPTSLATENFLDDASIRATYYAETEKLLRDHLPSGADVSKVVIFDHTIRRRDKSSPRQPVQQLHVDQTPGAAEVRVRRHVTDETEAEELLKKRYQIVNVWRPIENAAEDYPLAVVDWRSTEPRDFVKVDLLYPKRVGGGATDNENGTATAKDGGDDDDDDRGKETLPDPTSATSTAGYEVKGETYGVAPNDAHRFYYVKDMKPEEVLLIKCFDSWGRGVDVGDGKEGSVVNGEKAGEMAKIAACTPHTAFVDPATRDGAPGRQSIEVRCLVFY